MKIAVVMVTFNRIHDLQIAINRYEQQTLAPSLVIVVNNASTDGTKEYLEGWAEKKGPFQKKVIHLEMNTGGSGGFYTGLKYAFQTECDWYWIADDDAFLDFDGLNRLALFLNQHKELAKKCVALAGSVVLDPKTMEYDLGHRRTISVKHGLPKQQLVSVDNYQKEYFEIGLFTFVGSLVRAKAAKKAGLPHGDFFIYFDDIEYSYRIGKLGVMYCVPGCKVFHNTGKHEEAYGSNWRSYYQSRNMMLFYKEHFPRAYRRIVTKRILQRIALTPFGKYSSVNQMDWDAMVDASKDKKGISEKYYIGWKNDQYIN